MDGIVIVALVIAFVVCVTPGVVAWYKLTSLAAVSARKRHPRRRPHIRMRRA
jgi:uncharacterized iron-regulated membrane protein